MGNFSKMLENIFHNLTNVYTTDGTYIQTSLNEFLFVFLFFSDMDKTACLTMEPYYDNNCEIVL